jgi:Condensation domain/AMP-binding enzyme
MSDLANRVKALSPERRLLLQLLLKEKEGDVSQATIIPRRRESGHLPLSFAQERLWFLDQLETGNSFYNMPAAIRLSGKLNIEALKQTLDELMRRHEALRAAFVSRAGQPAQFIAQSLRLSPLFIDLSKYPAPDNRDFFRNFATKEAARPFDLSAPPLLRATLLRLGSTDHALLLSMHHIISDGWSIGVLVREVAALYQSYSQGAPSPLPELAVQYPDYALWQRSWLRGEIFETQLAYWRRQLAGAPALLALPSDSPRPAAQSLRGARLPLTLPGRLLGDLKGLAQREGATLFMTLLAAFQALLSRDCRQEDVVVGTRIAGRTRAETEPLIGLFINALALRTDLSGDPSFRELLGRVREATFGAYAHQELPFEELVKQLRPERSLSYAPLFNVMLALQNAPMPKLAAPGLTMERLDIESRTAKYDLDLTLWEEGEGLKGWIEYNADLFEGRTVERMMGRFERLLEAVAAEPERRIGSIPLLSPQDERLLRAFNDTGGGYPAEETLSGLFERQAGRLPEATALLCMGERLSFAELNQKANQLAHHLIGVGVGPETPVAALLPRSIDTVVTLLAILKAGGVYLPLDPAHPRESLHRILTQSRARVVVTEQALLGLLPGQEAAIICLDRDRDEISSQSLANPESRRG